MFAELPSSSENTSDLVRNAVIRLAGNSQDGIQSIGGFLARLAGRTQKDVMTYMTIPSTISGGPSIFQVHLGSGQVLTAGDEADFLFAFYQHSYNDHIGSLKAGGVCFYDSDHVTPNPDEKRFRQIGVPVTNATVEALGGSSRDRGKNMFVLGLLCSLFHLDREKLVSIVARQFGKKKEDVLRNAMLAFDAGFTWPLGDILHESYKFAPGESADTHRISTDGNQMLVCGLLAAGVRYGAGYPITPWSSVMESLRTELPKYGGIFLQTEDEIAAVSAALGAAYAGHLAITGSSGPGLSLKMEALSYASMAELPLIVVNVQRGGPSTGLPTSVEQSDLMQAIYGSHGDCPRIVLSPKNVEDCFYIALEAGRLAREYSCPVLILSDQAISTRIEAFSEPDLETHWIEPMLDLSTRDENFKPYPLEQTTRHAPPGSVMSGGKYPIVTGLEHDEWGHPAGSPAMHTKMTAKRRNKLVRLAAELPAPPLHGDSEGDVLVIGWGATYGPIFRAVDRLRTEGHKASAMHMRHLHPMADAIGPILQRFKHILVVEMNDYGAYGYGQLASLLRARYCNPAIQSLCKTDGLTFKISEIVTGAEKLLIQAKPSGNRSSEILNFHLSNHMNALVDAPSAAPVEKLTKKILTADHPTWCPGCGDFAVLHSFYKVLEKLQIPHEKIVCVAGIGCSSRFPYFVNSHGIHFIHGRALPLATGIALSRPDLHVFVFGGDGDGFSIGGNHLNHTARKNVNLTYVIMDNFVYGLTKAQTSPTSPIGFKSKTDPTGAVDQPINPMRQLISSGASFIARTHAMQIKHMNEMFERAILHEGFSVVETLSECVMFYPGAFDDGNPRKGGTFDTIDETQHDVSNELAAFELAGMQYPGKFGVFYEARRPTKNALEQKWIDQSRILTGGASGRELLKKRFEAMH